MTSQDGKSGETYFRRLVTRVTSLGRTARLRRQFADIEKRVLELPRAYRDQLAELIGRECDNVAAAPSPALYGAQVENGVTTNGLDIGLERSRSDNVQVRMRGLALWTAMVYCETRDGTTPESQELHRSILRLMRELKVFSSRAEDSGTRA
ncbi:MAG: hypothetical protein ACREP0_06730 [Rhodanobacteraceae bacterium]